ncbi:MAG: hypothetical protein J6C33_08860 [Lachnospiraceae bacterium]|nr:hypothetical protein [Lachnospiraceae bacterium]
MNDKEKDTELLLQNKELRISKNILIDKIETQNKEIRDKDEHITDMQKELLQLRSELEQKEKEQKKAEKKEKRRQIMEGINRFFDRVEGALYRVWLSVWIVIIGAALTLTATVLLNNDLRNSIFDLFNHYLAGH